jgi:serine protease Do
MGDTSLDPRKLPGHRTACGFCAIGEFIPEHAPVPYHGTEDREMRFVIPSHIALVIVFFALGAVSRADDPEKVSRRTPITEAVKRTKQGIVCIRAARPGGGKELIASGVIIDERGIIITNRHVVGAQRRVTVCLHDGARLTGEVLVADAARDLAIVRIDAGRSLGAIPLAPVTDLMVGETVIAIGHPLGYTNSVTTGIISALHRHIELPTGDVLDGLIQVSAPINVGNSGGALLNINGELIGINVAMRDGAQAIAFAINAGDVKTFLAGHLSAHRVSGVEHGLKCKEHLVAETGDRMQVIVKGATSADLRSGDQLVSVAGMDVANTFDVERAFWGRKPGQHVPLTVVREGEPTTVILTLGSSNEAGRVVHLVPLPAPSAANEAAAAAFESP